MFCAVSPAFSAMSVKFTMAGGAGAEDFACCAERRGANPQASEQAMMVRNNEEIGNSMSPVDVRGGIGLGSSKHGGTRIGYVARRSPRADC